MALLNKGGMTLVFYPTINFQHMSFRHSTSQIGQGPVSLTTYTHVMNSLQDPEVVTAPR